MPYVDCVVLTAAGDEALIDTTEARVDRVVSLSDALEDTHETFVAQIPQMQAL